ELAGASIVTYGRPRSSNSAVRGSAGAGSNTMAPSISNRATCSRSSTGGTRVRAYPCRSAVSAHPIAISVKNPRRENPPETPVGIEDNNAMECERPRRSRCARTLGRYLSSAATSFTRWRVRGSTLPSPFSECETVVGETPAARATSAIVTRLGPDEASTTSGHSLSGLQDHGNTRDYREREHQVAKHRPVQAVMHELAREGAERQERKQRRRHAQGTEADLAADAQDDQRDDLTDQEARGHGRTQ